MKISGTVAFKDLETGIWVLEADDGKTYQLAGGDRKIKKDGARVEVEGDVDGERLGFAMVGPTLVVKRYQFL